MPGNFILSRYFYHNLACCSSCKPGNADEEKRVKLAAKELYSTLTEKREELFIVGWQNDPQPKERVKGEIVYILNKFLPESYDREIFLRKSTLVFEHIVNQAMTGYNWVA